MAEIPFVKVHITDLIDDPRNLPVLLKRCSVAARNSHFVPWGQIIAFNLEAWADPNYTIAWGIALHWLDCY